jgi:hypothetical protein
MAICWAPLAPSRLMIFPNSPSLFPNLTSAHPISLQTTSILRRRSWLYNALSAMHLLSAEETFTQDAPVRLLPRDSCEIKTPGSRLTPGRETDTTRRQCLDTGIPKLRKEYGYQPCIVLQSASVDMFILPFLGINSFGELAIVSTHMDANSIPHDVPDAHLIL